MPPKPRLGWRADEYAANDQVPPVAGSIAVWTAEGPVYLPAVVGGSVFVSAPFGDGLGQLFTVVHGLGTLWPACDLFKAMNTTGAGVRQTNLVTGLGYYEVVDANTIQVVLNNLFIGVVAVVRA